MSEKEGCLIKSARAISNAGNVVDAIRQANLWEGRISENRNKSVTNKDGTNKNFNPEELVSQLQKDQENDKVR